MNAFLADLWADLRAKRLWPVALVLAIALVAVPFVLLEPAADDAPAPPPSAAASAPAPKTVVATAQAPEQGSRLGVFDSHNPFASKADSPPQADTGSGAGGGSAAASASGISAGASTAMDTGAGSTTSGGGTSAPTGSSGGDSGGGSTPRTTLYTYSVAVRFGRAGSERRYDEVDRMDLLPSDRNPMLVFLGASVEGDEAVFLIDSSLSQTGEGVCKPSADSCSFLYLKPGNDRDEHTFADSQGREYKLQLLSIDRKKVGAKSSAARHRGTKAKRATARKSAREFLFRPFLLDGVRR